ncbi:hypothetical protein RFI_20189 [Reticulomyxa filosa]|uniref:Uncharacterized protein n=1 Tax=Reticulomyxa filosa TaxID=46433 RepID=X6MTG2_RETFI|nr:hypothetical protein RFI_20189 [Reticulomyxa filosa]|eukprot:ETO17144.1 hypothetical protein RFI_20189 [Reticulomyxa filosa]
MQSVIDPNTEAKDEVPRTPQSPPLSPPPARLQVVDCVNQKKKSELGMSCNKLEGQEMRTTLKKVQMCDLAISERIEESKKAMKAIHNFFQVENCCFICDMYMCHMHVICMYKIHIHTYVQHFFFNGHNLSYFFFFKKKKTNKKKKKDSAKNSFSTSQTMAKFSTLPCAQHEIGTMNFSLTRFTELIETMSKNEEILGCKFRTICQQKMSEQIKRFEKLNNSLLTDLTNWHKQLEKESKQLAKAQQNYEEKKKQVLAVEQSLKIENQKFQTYSEKQMRTKQKKQNKKKNAHTHIHIYIQIPQAQNNIITLENKRTHLRAQSREALDEYITAVSGHRSFRIRFDTSTSSILDKLERTGLKVEFSLKILAFFFFYKITEVERAKVFHKLLNVYLEIQQVMITQSLKNIETVKEHITNLDPNSDNALFIEKSRTDRHKPPLPEPILSLDDIGLSLCVQNFKN